ncbi:transposase [Fervidobacterium thailandense]|uniref:RNA-guided endonuclease InsQ/TnpB family protein n=1 Tax=Fervidobacterium thailandense TaxID=1008305 RepID=UPI00355C6D9C
MLLKEYITKSFVFDLSRKTDKKLAIIFGHLTYSASKLWNVANYEVEKNGVSIYELEHKLKDNFFARNLHSQSAQAVLQKLQVAWKNTFDRHTKRPRYQPKDGHFPVTWKENGFKVVGHKLRLSLSKQTKDYLKSAHGIESEYVWIELPKTLSLDSVKIQQVELVPYQAFGHISYSLRIIYREPIQDFKDRPQLNEHKVLAIDLGVSNFATCTDGAKSFIIDGRVLLSKLRLVNKKTARLKAVLDRQKLKTSKRLHRLYRYRQNYVNDFVHKASRSIVDYCFKNGIGVIVVGKLNHGIANIDIGSQNNQKLHQMPYGKFLQKLKYKAKTYGIQVIQIDEAYTSQTCSCCGAVDKNNRKHRGLYVCSSCGMVLNADVNGALNILKKVSPSSVAGVGVGALASPVRLRLVS